MQRLLLRSRAAKALAVRQVTQLNAGRKTEGVDEKTALSTKKRLDLCQRLVQKWDRWKHQKLRRVNIPKSNGKTRGLGIPTIADRAWQCMLKYAADTEGAAFGVPAYEATAGERSYGFRLGRSAHDAQKLIYANLQSNHNKNNIVLKTDISKCFDKISHKAILKGVVLPKEAKKVLREGIKAGVKGEYPSSEEGTPQGGVISPLLANIALDGFENLGSDQWKGNRRDGTLIKDIRYADDAIFICKPGAEIQKLRRDIDEWLARRGLQINEAKTKVSKAREGFDFLGWHFRVDSRGRFKSTPSHESYVSILELVKKTWRDLSVPDKTGAKRDTETRLKAIGSKVRGWRNYHRFCDMGKDNLWLCGSFSVKVAA